MSSLYNYDLFLKDSSDDTPLARPVLIKERVETTTPVPPVPKVLIYIQITMFKGIMEDVSAFFEEPAINNDNKPDEHWDNGIKVFNIPIL